MLHAASNNDACKTALARLPSMPCCLPVSPQASIEPVLETWAPTRIVPARIEDYTQAPSHSGEETALSVGSILSPALAVLETRLQ